MTKLPDLAISDFQSLLGPKGWSMEADILEGHNKEARGKFEGKAEIILYPASTHDVAEITRICIKHNLSIVPQGGNTGRCGGAVGDASQVLVNLKRMNRIIEVDPLDFTATVQAGAILAHIHDAAEKHDLMFPLALGSEGSCQIGGNISTNAGGLNVIAYGMTRDLVLGLEVVLPDGEIWNGLSKLRKDNTGYDLCDLFIGAEGTLGIITKATLKLFPRPKHVATTWVALDHPQKSLDLLALCKRTMGDGIGAFEIMSSFAYETSLAHLSGLKRPVEAKAPWYALVELTSTRPKDDLNSVLEGILETAFAKAIISDAIIAQSSAQRSNLWAIREGIPEAQGFEGGSIKHDVSVPVSRVPELLERGIKAGCDLVPGIRPCPFGHVGDGNIHFNFTQPKDMNKANYLAHWEELNRVIHDIVIELEGSISAEHGIGMLKRDELSHYAPAQKMALLKKIKHAIDPENRMNPGKVVSI